MGSHPERPMRRPRGWVLAASLLAWTPAAAARSDADAVTTLRLCIDRSAGERAAAALLARFLRSVHLEAVAGPRCRAPSLAYAGRFASAGARVELIVEAPGGATVVRPVPWIAPSATPLSHLVAEDRLSEFSVIVHGALAEHRSAPHLAPQPPLPPPLPPIAEPPRPTPVTFEPPPLPPGPALAYVPPAKLPTRPPPPRPTPTRSLARAAPTAARPAATTVARVAPRAPATRTVDIWVGGISRAPGLASPQVGGTFAWRALFLRGAVDGRQWRWGERELSLRALAAEVGVRVPILARGQAGLSGTAALLAERIVLRRRDVPDARDHGYWEGGATAGITAAWRPRSWLYFAVFGDAGYRPTARQVEIAGGPSLRLNAWSLRAALAAGVSW
jgi:hypothetical protein